MDGSEGIASLTPDETPRTVSHPAESDLPRFVDKYFLRTKEVVAKFGDIDVSYAVFMRRPVTSAPRLAMQWLERMAKARDVELKVDLKQKIGRAHV